MSDNTSRAIGTLALCAVAAVMVWPGGEPLIALSVVIIGLGWVWSD